MLRISILSMALTLSLLTVATPTWSDVFCDPDSDGFCNFGTCLTLDGGGFCEQVSISENLNQCDCVLVPAVPSVSQWGVITLMLSLSGLGALTAQRRLRGREPSE